MSRNLGHYIKQERGLKRRVWLNSDTGVAKGYAVCYDRDYGTAANLDGQRDKFVNIAGTTNNFSFAGVTAYAYANKKGGQWIEIFEPGSVCQAFIDGAVTIGEKTFVTAIVGTGKFHAIPGLPGKGTARVLQTLTGEGLGLVELMDGPESGLVELLTPIDNAAAQSMVGGYTLLQAVTIGTGNSTATLANGTFVGQRKGIKVEGAIVTNDWVLTVTTGVKVDGTTAITTVGFDAANESALFEWDGVQWQTIGFKGATFA